MRARHRARLVVAGLAVLVLGAGSGLALGGFAAGVTRPSMTGDALLSSGEESAEVVEASAPAEGRGPESYVCQGCGPSLAEREAQSYSAHYAAADPGYDAAYDLAKDYAPLPAYRPMPYDGDEPVGRTMIVEQYSVEQ